MNRRHLRTILWLRWRLSRNQWSRGGQLNAVLTMIIVIAGFIIGTLGAIGGMLAGIFGLAKVSPMVLLGIWDGIVVAFLFFWMIGLVSELQRSETIDIGKMLHLPISLKDIFLVNYLASHLTVGVILFLPAMLGLSLGLLLGRSLYMILMFPLTLSFIFMITAWTYCLRGWLVTLMVNKRRRRAIIAGITFVFILVFQLPNLLGNVLRDHNRHRPRTTQTTQPNRQTETPSGDIDKLGHQRLVLIAHDCVPFLWVGNGARALAMGNPWPAVLGAAGGFVIGGLGLRRAYRSTVRFYQGRAIRAVTKKKQKKKKVIHVRKEPLAGKLPGVSAQTSALASAFFRSLARAPEAKMMLATNLIMLLIFGVSILFRRSAAISHTYKPFVVSGAVAVTFFGVSQLMFNMFGMDRNGFRTLVLTPLPRKKILLSKNLACLPVVLGIGIILLIVVKFAVRLTLVMVLAGVLQLIAAFLLLSIVGNLVSVLVPYRIAPGSMKPTKTTTLTTVFIVLSHMSFPMVILPVFLVPVVGWLVSGLGWLPAGPTNVLVALLLLGPLVFFYQLSLEPLGELLLKREKKILGVVTKEIE
jgi:ABC-2 type transport system permease protein